MAEDLLPPDVLRNLGQVDVSLGKVEEEMKTVLSNFSREALEELTPVERAATFLTLSKTVNALFSLYLKTNGLSPDDHQTKSELVRVDLYKEKVQKAADKNSGPQRPTSSLDVQAANRFIEHAIPDLSEDLKRRVRAVGSIVKRQHDRQQISNFSPTKRASGLSVADEAAAFLAETVKELQNEKASRD